METYNEMSLNITEYSWSKNFKDTILVAAVKWVCVKLPSITEYNSIARHKTVSEGKKAKFLVISPQQSYTWCFESNQIENWKINW